MRGVASCAAAVGGVSTAASARGALSAAGALAWDCVAAGALAALAGALPLAEGAASVSM